MVEVIISSSRSKAVRHLLQGLPLLLFAFGCGGQPALEEAPTTTTSPETVATSKEDLRISCRTEADCAWLGGAACVAGRCAACTKHADCGSQVCDVAQPTFLGLGQCVPEAKVTYVDAQACRGRAGCGGESLGTGSKGDPLCDIGDGIARAGAAGTPVVRVMPGSYCPFRIDGQSVTVIGSGNEGGGTEVTEEDVGGSSVRGGGTVVLDGLALGRHSTYGLTCAAGESGPTKLTVRRSEILSDLGTALDAEGCTLKLDRNRISGRSGALALRSCDVRASNNFISGVSERPAVRVDGGKARFLFNTVTLNAVDFDGDTAGAFSCGSSPVMIEDSIVVNNAHGATGSQFSGACELNRVVVGPFDTISSPGAIVKGAALDGHKLLADPANDDCCIDKGGMSPFVLFDLDGGRRPRGRGWDIGAFEEP